MSSSNITERGGTEASRLPMRSSVMLGEARLRVQTLSYSSDASAVTSEVLPVPGVPYSK